MFNKNTAIPEEYTATLKTKLNFSDNDLSKIHSQMVKKEKKNPISYLYKKKSPDKVSFEDLFYKAGKYIAGTAIGISTIHIICDTFDIGSVSSSIYLNYENYLISFLEDMNIYNKDLYNTIYNTKIDATDVILLSPAIPVISKGIGLLLDNSLSKIYDIVKEKNTKL
ncbi:MAG: hypothetical protein KAS11_01030 [Candidatus Aenigmarchaeota archaeon]|nr:hypothetical protein [Candidatus Aenigmarchaeota archaeon]